MTFRQLTTFSLILSCFAATEARTIQGRVFNAADSTQLEGVDCSVMAGGQTIIKATTQPDGSFSLATDAQSGASLEIEKAGFSPAYVSLPDGRKNVDIGNIFLEKSTQLGEVTVTANSAVNKDGKTIVYPSVAEVKASPTALSLFQKLPLPGLLPDPVNRTMSVDGGAPMILINGVPSTMADLNALQPKDIDKVEYSRITPARYADKGVSGLLSITLRKRNDGGQVYAWGRSAVNTTFMDAQLRASYHQGASQFTLSYSPSWRNYQNVYDDYEESFIGKDFRVDLEAHDRAPFYYHMHDIRLKYDLSPSAKTLFSATFNINPFANASRAYSRNVDTSIGEYENNNESKSKEMSPSLDLFLRQDFNDRNSLEAQMVGTLSSSDYRRDNTYIYPGRDPESYLMNVDSRRRSLITEVSYIHSFSTLTSLSGGVQNTISRSTNTYLDSDYRPLLTENNNYIYARLSHRFGPVYISVSSGAKLFWVKNDMIRRHFIRNLSTAQISWNIDARWNIQGSFQYTPAIPSLSALTDYRQQTSPYLFSNGNPDLKVAENFRYRIQAAYNIKKFSASFQSVIADTRNAVINDITYMGDGHFLSQSVNAKKARGFYNSLTLQLRNIHGFGASLYAALNHYNTAGEGWEHSLTSFSGSMSLWWNKGPFTVSYWRSLPGKYLNGHSVNKEENGDALQIDFQPDKHWTIGASWMYMFEKKGTQYPSWNYSEVNPSYRDRYIRDNANMIVLSVSYTADFGSIFRTARRNLNNSDNSSSLLKM
ncbi:MAG: outer membrane beta-barrel family protein [Muribaculaceae bacterium]|nr:outer membrane beta-barrel family protein [Muribaculaceae bacterium]